MITRNVNNYGRPLTSVRGTVLRDVEVSFTLCKDYIPTSTFDAITGEYISELPISARTDENGEFSIYLWPTSRGEIQLEYVVKINTGDKPDMFSAPLLEDATPISFVDFRHSGNQVPPAEISSFAAHITNYTMHVTPEQNEAMDASNIPSGSNPFATLSDINFAGGHTHSNKPVLDGLSEEEGVLHYNGQDISGGSGVIDHTQLLNVGIYTHQAIDNHITETTSAHGGIVSADDPRLSDTRNPKAHTQALNTISDVTISAANLNTLDDGTDTTLHYHSADRNRANHTGSQDISTVNGLQTALNSKANTSSLSVVAGSGIYSDLLSKPILGTASSKDVASSGNASSTQVVLGSDTRLNDARTPLSHSQNLLSISDVTISAANLNTLDDGVNTNLHFHTADRDRANHTGSQAISTVSNLQATLDSKAAKASILSTPSDITLGSYSTIACSGTAQTLTLPSATELDGKIYIIKKTSASGTITINTTSSQTIDGALTLILDTQWQSRQLQSDGANWLII